MCLLRLRPHTVRRAWLALLGSLTLLPLAAAAEPAAAPNLFFDVAAGFVADGTAAETAESEPVCDRILGVRITGTARTCARSSIVLVPCEEVALLDIAVTGVTHTDTVGVKDPVHVYTRGRATLHAHQRLAFDADGVRVVSEPAASVRLDTTLLGFSTRFRAPLDQVVRLAALRAYRRDKAEATAIAERRAASRLAERLGRDAAPRVKEANRSYAEEVRGALERRGLFPRQARTHTTADWLTIAGRIEGRSRPPAIAAPPAVGGRFDVVVRVQESLPTAAAEILFGGKRYTEKGLKDEITALLGRAEATRPADPDKISYGSVTFPKERPIETRFADGGFTVRVRGRYPLRDVEYDMDTTATYQLERTPTGLRAVRQGRLDVFPPNKVRGKDKLSAPEQTLRTLVEDGFERVFQPRLELTGIPLRGEMAKLGKLVPTQGEAEAGWLTIGLNRSGPARP